MNKSTWNIRRLPIGLLFGIVAATAMVSNVARADSWSTAIEQNQMETPCKGKNIMVDPGHDCPSAIAAATKLLAAEVADGCVVCRNPVYSCRPDPYTRPNGSKATRWQISATCAAPQGCAAGTALTTLNGAKYCCPTSGAGNSLCCTKAP